MLHKLMATVMLAVISLAGYTQPWMQAPYLQVPESEAGFNDVRDAYNRLLSEYENESDIPGYKQFRRWESLWEHHVYPDGILPPAGYYFNQKQLFQPAPQPESSHNGTWIPLGITNWALGGSGYNPGNGRVNTVTVDPKNPNVLYIGTPSGGIWKSTDHGQTWTTSFDDMPALGVSAIAIHPQNTDTVYIGTGDRDASDSKATGIWVSHDGGSTWLATGFSQPLNTHRVNKILINEQNPMSLLAATRNGIFQSYDAGATWTQRLSGDEVKNLLYRPGDTSIVYGVYDAFFRSTDGGQSFTKVTNGIASDTSRLEISVSPANPDMVYAVGSRTTNNFGAFYCSTDKGLSFRIMSNQPNILGYAMDATDKKGQGWYDLAVAASPNFANMVFVGGVNVWFSPDTGKTWHIKAHWVYDLNSPDEYTHADIHYLGFYGQKLYCGSDGGVFYSPSNGSEFYDLSAGLGITQFYRLGMYAPNPGWMAAGAQDNGSNIYNNGQWMHAYGADGMEAAINPVDSFIVYISSQNGGIRRSDDAGETFTGIRPDSDPSGGWITPFAIHPQYPDRIVAAYNKIYISNNAGEDYRVASPFLAAGSTLHDIALAPTDTSTIYVARYGNLYVTRNSGGSWSTKVPLSGYSITGISVDNLDADRLWISMSGSSGDKVLYSHDGGINWTDISGNLTNLGFNDIAQVQGTHDALYLATEVGIWYTDTTLSGWIAFNDDLPNVRVRELEVSYPGQIIRAATYGRGIWESYLYGTAQSIEERTLEAKLYPNPAADAAVLELAEPGIDLRADLFSISGQHLRNLHSGPMDGQRLQIPRAGLPSGIYFLRISEKSKVRVMKLVFE